MNLDIKLKDNTKKILEELKKSKAFVRVGVRSDGVREEGKSTNTEIGLAHEFGTSKLPQRSFLRMPLSEKLFEYMKNNGAFKKRAMDKMLEEGGLIDFLTKVSLTSEQVVSDAFDTGGFGNWIPSSKKRKKNHQTLVETTELRESIASEVVDV